MSWSRDLRDDVEALFLLDGSDVVPTIYATGAWSPGAVRGPAVAALFASFLEPPGATVARMTMDLVAPVPLRRLRLEVIDQGGGRRVQRSTAVLCDGDRAVARAEALYVTGAATQDPDASVNRPPCPELGPPPAPLEESPPARSEPPDYERHAMARHTRQGPGEAFHGWFSLLMPVFTERPISGFQCAAAAAYYSSGGTATVLPQKEWSYKNLDLTVSLTRRPVGDWIGLVAERSTLGDQGVGVAASVLHDVQGPIGRGVVTQFLEQLH